VVAANLEYLSISDGSQTGLDFGTGDFSCSIWFYADTLGVNQRLMGKKNTGTGVDAGWFCQLTSGNKVSCRIADGTGNVLVTHDDVLSGDTLYLAIVTFDRDGNMGVSVNAGTEKTGDITSAALTVDNGIAFNIANIAGAAGSTFGGGLVCAGVWNTLLDATARTALYNSGSPLLYSALPGAVPTPVSYWNLDEQSDGSGAVTRMDSTANNNDLTDNNTCPSSAFPFTG
jgi:hypothetical protein